jgi:hypothetical protein
MTHPNNFDRPESGIAISVGFGAICALLLGLIIWQPEVAVWIARSAEAEFASAPDSSAPGQLAQTRRRPIEPGAWSQSITPKDSQSNNDRQDSRHLATEASTCRRIQVNSVTAIG